MEVFFNQYHEKHELKTAEKHSKQKKLKQMIWHVCNQTKIEKRNYSNTASKKKTMSRKENTNFKT